MPGTPADDEAILIALLKTIKEELKKPEYKGEKGDTGTPGTPADIDAVADAVIAKMPPITVQIMGSENGVSYVHEQLTFAVGQPIQLPPTLVRRFARDGKTAIDVEAYPLGTHINMRFGAEVIPANEVK